MTQTNSTALRDTSWQQLANVAYWRLFVNAALTVCDMAAFVLASVIVLMARNEAALYSARFHFHINLAVYVVVCALIWALCMHNVGVYHRHVMGDGYQLNLLRGRFYSQHVCFPAFHGADHGVRAADHHG